MLDEFNYEHEMEKQIYKEKFNKLKNDMASLQLKMREKDLSDIVLFEGPSTSG